MKKILLLTSLAFVLTACFSSNKDLETAKQELIGNTPSEATQEDVVKGGDVLEEEDIETSQNIQFIELSPQQFLEFDDINESSLTSGEVEISGSTIGEVDKIMVLFSNATSDYPDDDYTLQTFSPGDSDFIYRASSRNQVLDFGVNEYIFRGYIGDEFSETKLVLVVPSDDEEDDVTRDSLTVESDIIGEEGNTLLVDFPVSPKYGEPIKLGEASFTYSGIKGLEVSKEVFSGVTCDGITEFLSERINTWFYWNTCRDIVKDFGIKFNVLRLDGERYIYERHYLDFRQGFYGIYELQTGTGVDSENIAEKNTELKDQEFPSVKIVDELMKDIVTN